MPMLPSPVNVGPTPIPPIGAMPVDLRAAGTTSSSSAASADEPNRPFGLGDLLAGEFDLGLGLSPFAVVALADPEGRAIGARGREIGPRFCRSGTAGALDPAASERACILRRPDPGANEDGGPPGVVGDPEGPAIGVLGFEGGPIGDGMPEGRPGGPPRG